MDEQLLEAVDVELLGLEQQPVAASLGDYAPVSQHFAQLRDVDVDAVEGTRRRGVAPECLDQAVGGDGFSIVEQENGK